MSDLKKYVPETTSWLRAAISSIPIAGSALDHLIFDKADVIRIRNLEAAIAALSDQLSKLGQDAIDKDWFSSDEALAVFRMLSDKASYEPDKIKVDALGKLVASCGTKNHSSDDKKLSVLDHLARLSAVQIKLLSVLQSTPTQQKKFSTGDLEQTASAIWLADIRTNLERGPVFWTGKLILDLELEILESLNTIRRVQLLGPGELGYTLTGIGRHAATYLPAAGL